LVHCGNRDDFRETLHISPRARERPWPAGPLRKSRRFPRDPTHFTAGQGTALARWSIAEIETISETLPFHRGPGNGVITFGYMSLTGGGLVALCRAALLGAVVLQALDALDADQALAFGQADEPDALRIAAELRDTVHRRAHQGAGRADQHDLLAGQHLQRRDGRAIAVRGLHGDDALAAPAMHRKILYGRALAVTRCGRREHAPGILALSHHDERDDLLVHAELDAAYAGGLAAHGTYLAFREADGLAAARNQHDLALTVGDRNTDES